MPIYATMRRTPATTVRLMTAAWNRPGFVGCMSPRYVAATQATTVAIMSGRLRNAATKRIGNTNPSAPTTFAGATVSRMTMTRKTAPAIARTIRFCFSIDVRRGGAPNNPRRLKRVLTDRAGRTQAGTEFAQPFVTDEILDAAGILPIPVWMGLDGARHVRLGKFLQAIF